MMKKRECEISEIDIYIYTYKKIRDDDGFELKIEKIYIKLFFSRRPKSLIRI